MDSVIATHIVAATLATSRELLELWRRMIGAGPTMAMSGKLVALAWVGSSGVHIRAHASASADDLVELERLLAAHPTYRYALVQHGKRVKLIVYQCVDEIARGEIVTRSSLSSPLIITYRPDDDERAERQAVAAR
jgi:hypothetical protein